MKRWPTVLCMMFAGAATAETCIEVHPFEVVKRGISTKAEKRAAMVPREVVETVQQNIALEVQLAMDDAIGIVPADEACADGSRVLMLTGRFTDYKPGSAKVRRLVGMGAGAQKFAVAVTLTDKASGAVLGTDEVVDRKVAGFAGGSDEKGLEDFAEKMLAFVKRSVGR